MKNEKEKSKTAFLWSAPTELKKKLVLLAESNDVSISRLITEAVKEFCDKKKKVKIQ